MHSVVPFLKINAVHGKENETEIGAAFQNNVISELVTAFFEG